ncbi:imidazoleglycerol-phosphate dehydratase HisB [Candidatus Auribacterota bacterium]
MTKKRTATVKRKTSETDILLKLNIDGQGISKISTPIGFLNHMLTSLSKHALLDLELKVKGDTEVDDHHTVEDTGICLGEALKKALGDKKGIKRFGTAQVPMDEALCAATIDLSSRPYFDYGQEALLYETKKIKIKGSKQDFDLQLIGEFFKALVLKAEMTLHIEIKRGKNLHHIYEAMFKAVARALYEACSLDPRVKNIPSTKGTL